MSNSWARISKAATAIARQTGNKTAQSVWRDGGVKFQSTAANTALKAAAPLSPKIKDIDPNTLDLRVGMIKEIRRHENADSLYVSQIQVGPNGEDASILQVCSGLVGLVDMEALHGRRIVIVNNLKPSKMRGVASQAMLLCADGETTVDGETKPNVEPVCPPEDAPLGGSLSFVHEDDAEEKVSTVDGKREVKKRIKSKAFQAVSEDLTVDNTLRVVWRQKHVLCHDIISRCCTVSDPKLAGAQVR